MIITKEVYATVSGRNKEHYEKKGYKLPYQKDRRGRIGIPKGTKIKVSVFDLHPHSTIKVKYKCDDCEKINSVKSYTIFTRKNSQYLKTKETICSTCANKRMSGPNSGQYIHGSLRFPEYRYNARKRKIKFELTPDQFKEITEKKCFYCGGNSIDRNKKSRGNGIDRKDSAIGYVYSNCVPCCATCNFVKNKMEFDDFILYIRKLYNNTKDLII